MEYACVLISWNTGVSYFTALQFMIEINQICICVKIFRCNVFVIDNIFTITNLITY